MKLKINFKVERMKWYTKIEFTSCSDPIQVLLAVSLEIITMFLKYCSFLSLELHHDFFFKRHLERGWRKKKYLNYVLPRHQNYVRLIRCTTILHILITKNITIKPKIYLTIQKARKNSYFYITLKGKKKDN